MTRCQICHDVMPEADWSAHITLHENAPMDERWDDCPNWVKRYLDEERHDLPNHDDR